MKRNLATLYQLLKSVKLVSPSYCYFHQIEKSDFSRPLDMINLIWNQMRSEYIAFFTTQCFWKNVQVNDIWMKSSIDSNAKVAKRYRRWLVTIIFCVFRVMPRLFCVSVRRVRCSTFITPLQFLVVVAVHIKAFINN